VASLAAQQQAAMLAQAQLAAQVQATATMPSSQTNNNGRPTTPTNVVPAVDMRAMQNVTPPQPAAQSGSPQANGVNGFMFTSPVRTGKKMAGVHINVAASSLVPKQLFSPSTKSRNELEDQERMMAARAHGHGRHPSDKHKQQLIAHQQQLHLQQQSTGSSRTSSAKKPHAIHMLANHHPHMPLNSAVPPLTGTYHYPTAEHQQQVHQQLQQAHAMRHGSTSAPVSQPSAHQHQSHFQPYHPGTAIPQPPAHTTAQQPALSPGALAQALRTTPPSPGERLVRSASSSRGSPVTGNEILFSPYPVTVHSQQHGYYTRSAAARKAQSGSARASPAPVVPQPAPRDATMEMVPTNETLVGSFMLK
jgi:hypothetical protein